jgi:hypothetical protein
MKNTFSKVLVDNDYVEQFKDYLYDSFGIAKHEYTTFKGILFTSFRLKNISKEDLEQMKQAAYNLI